VSGEARCSEQARFVRALAGKLSEAMGERGMLASEVADAAGIPRSTLYNVMRGKCVPSALVTAKLCVVLGLDANRLLGVRR